MNCHRCDNDPQPRNFNSPRDCAFKNGEFTASNWNCGTMTLIRTLAYDGLSEQTVSFRSNDSSLGVVSFGDGEYAVLTWYKDRGRTSQAYVMFDDDEPRPMTLADANEIIKEYSLEIILQK